MHTFAKSKNLDKQSAKQEFYFGILSAGLFVETIDNRMAYML